MMATYIILSRLAPGAVSEPKDFKKLGEAVSKRIRRECPKVTWKQSYAVTGRFDFVDIVESNDLKQVERAAMIIRAEGQSETETMVAVPWPQFLRGL